MTPYMQNILANRFATEATYLSVHTGDPSTTGANELSGGGYARQALSWGSASAGAVTAAAVAFAIPASTTIAYIGFWTASSGGTFLESRLVNITFVTAGSYGPTPKYEQLTGV